MCATLDFIGSKGQRVINLVLTVNMDQNEEFSSLQEHGKKRNSNDMYLRGGRRGL